MITDKIVIETINESLYRQYRVLDGRAIYRIVWSADQLEIRKGKFSEFYGHVFLREYTAVKEIKKYWYFEKPCWVLEKLVFVQGIQQLKDIVEELVEAGRGTYETIYPFRDAKGNALPVNHQVVEIILWKLHNPSKPLTESDVAAIEQANEKAEVDYFENQLEEDARSDLFVFENSAFVSTRQMKFKQTYTEKSSPVPELLNSKGVVNGPIISA